MILVKGKPPIYQKIIDAGLYPTDSTVFTYGDKLFIQDLNEKEIDPVLLAHEKHHSKQQGDRPNEWWDKYIFDEKFRFQQELEAYVVEYKMVKKLFNNKIQKYALHRFAQDLSSSMYGNLITTPEAESRIRNQAK